MAVAILKSPGLFGSFRNLGSKRALKPTELSLNAFNYELIKRHVLLIIVNSLLINRSLF